MINEKRNKWTQEELDFMKEHYQTMSDKELSQYFGTHSETSVATKRKRMHYNRTNKKYDFQDVINEFAKTDYILLSTE